MNMTKIEQLVRKFFLESSFKNKTLLELYRMFKETTDEVISFDDFKDAYFLTSTDLIINESEIDDDNENISSLEEIHAIYTTPAYYYFSKAYQDNLDEYLSSVLDDTIPMFIYSDLDFGDIPNAYYENKDYTIYRFGIDSDGNYTNRTIEYSITAEELKKQVNEAVKEIKSVGKISILPE